VENVGGVARSVSWGCCGEAEEDAGEGDGSDECGVGAVRIEKRRDEDGRTEREAGGSEAIARLQEMEGMVIDDWTMEVGEGVSVDTTELRLPEQSTNEGVQGADTQPPDSEEGMHTLRWKEEDELECALST
jgi:hypothetical protein